MRNYYSELLNAHIFLPVDIGGKLQKIVFRVAHRFKNVKIYWFKDDEYLISKPLLFYLVSKPQLGYLKNLPND